MDIPDIISEILEFSGRIPEKYARISTSFLEGSQMAKQRILRTMDRKYPLWNLDPDESPGSDIEDIIRYHLNKAALDDDWDAFYLIAQHHMQRMINSPIKIPHLHPIYTAIYIYCKDQWYDRYGKQIILADERYNCY